MVLPTGGGNARVISTVLTAQDAASGTLRDVEDAGDDAKGELQETEESAANLGRRFAFLAGATTTLSGVMAVLVHQQGAVQQTFAQMGVVAAETDAELRQMRETAAGVAMTMPIAMGEAAEGMQQLAFAGFEAEEAMAAVQGVSELSVASMMDMGEAARTTGSFIRMFNMDADEADRITASLAATFSMAATNIRELSSAVERAGAVASMLGAEFEEVIGVLGTMANAGVRAERAGTAVNSMLTQLTTQSSRAEEAMAELGVELDDFVDESGELVDLNVMVAELAGSLDEMDNRLEQVRIATELFGQRGARAILTVADEVDDIEAMIEEQFLAQIDTAIARADDFDEPAAAIRHFRQEGESTADVAGELVVELGLSEQAAIHFAEEIAEGERSVEELAEDIEDATTSTELMEAQLETASGALEFFRGTMSQLGHEIFVGFAPAVERGAFLMSDLTAWVAENQTAARALGGTLVVTTGAMAALTAATAAQIGVSKAAIVLQGTLAGALIAKAGGAFAAAGGLAAMTVAGAPLWAVLLAILGIVGGLVAILRTDFLGAGEQAGAVLGWLGDRAGGAVGHIQTLGRILYELGRILLVIGSISILGPFAVLLRLPGLLREAGSRTRDAAAEIPGMIVSGLGRLGPAKYALPIIGPLLIARSMVTDPGKWVQAGRQIPTMLADGIRAAAGAPVDAITAVASDVRDRLPFSPAAAGPLATIDQIGPGFMASVTSSLERERGSFTATVERVLQPPAGGVLGGDGNGAALAPAGGGDTYTVEIGTIDVTVTGGDATEAEVEEATRRGASEIERVLQQLTRATPE